jgi:hypothetical protein
MTQDQAYRIEEWVEQAEGRSQKAEGTTDNQFFERGLALLGEVMTNTFYLGNIRRKGSLAGMSILKYELQKKSLECLKFGVAKVEGGSTSSPTGTGKQDAGGKKVAGRELGVTHKSPEGDLKNTAPNPERENRKAFVLRKEFPFLASDDCPEEFKILVNDMINSHERYVKGHPNLFAVANKGNEACFEAGKLVVENYLNNRKCWEELEHYKKTGQILGTHPLFAKRKQETELKNMPVTELSALYRNLPRNIRYYGKLIEDDADNELTGERLEKKKWFEWELVVVKRLLEVRERRSTSSRSGVKKKNK